MKSWDLCARRHRMPKYSYYSPPPPSIVALLYLTELRYESFTPNHVHIAPGPSTIRANDNDKPPTNKNHKPISTRFSEQTNLLIHTVLFILLQTVFPQSNSTVLALQVLLAIYILWESLQLILRYHSSPPLFGPIYSASSLGVFWSETWHSAFASPCRSLAYEPLRTHLPRLLGRYLGVPSVPLAKAAGIIASFAMMGIFHVYALTPLLHYGGLVRVTIFFLLNGVGTVVEGAIWGRRTHWAKTLLAWLFELMLASWTVEGMRVPKGLNSIQWRDLCVPRNDGL